MEKAKQAAASFLSKDGKHKTSVDQDVRGAVTEEHVHPHQHENVTTAVDKEVHQHHHQTRIQPVKHEEVLPETSSHVVNPVEHREFHHENDTETRGRLQQDAAAFKNSSVTHETTHSTSDAPIVTGEHVHHHVHEHIQPVIQKETAARHVVHRTAPVHETHYAQPIHHEATTLPVKTLDEFKSTHGGVQGKATSALREFDGCPGPYNKERNLPSTALHQTESPTETGMGYSPSSGSRSGLTGGAGAMDGNSGLRSSDKTGLTGTSNLTDSSSRDGNYTLSDKKGAGIGAGSATSSSAMPRSQDPNLASDGTRRKSSLMDRVQDKLNPKVDSDGDGKKGVLS